jgi:hypothetical protein
MRRLLTAFTDWMNVPVWMRGELEVRRIDIIMAIMGVFIFCFYLLLYSWQWAVLGTLTYIMVLMVVLWML